MAQDNTLWWILGIGVVGYFGYEYLQNQSATSAPVLTPTTTTVTTPTSINPVTAPPASTQTTAIAAPALNLPVQRTGPIINHPFIPRGPVFIGRG